MYEIKLFSGMDFSGKTTIVGGINTMFPGKFKIQKKFLTPITMIDEVRKREKWLPAEEWKPLLQKTIKQDINNYTSGNKPILQDTLWIIKYLATTIEKGAPEDKEEIRELYMLLEKYPEMDSFYITASMEERLNRYKLREKNKIEITGSDKMINSKDQFLRIEKIYKEIVFKRFPNTKIIDTTNKDIENTLNEVSCEL